LKLLLYLGNLKCNDIIVIELNKLYIFKMYLINVDICIHL
jgi:hypothetical protein